MNQQLQNILNIVQQESHLTDEQKNTLSLLIKDVEKEMEVISFKLDRTEKVKRTTAILLEETIEELEQKRKAVEAQNRELEIEAALEKVRAKSLAMHHTSELQQVVNIAAQQLQSIRMEINGGVFICINAEAKSELSIWASGGMADYVQKVIVPYLNKPIFTTLRAAIIKGNNFLTEAYSDKEKRELFTHLFNYDPWRSLPQERMQELLARKGGFARSVVISQYTSISITNHHGKAFTEEENEILKRFGKVFEQSYIRFLDLQKAEAQAREAQIEAALERIRSRSMAMHNSSDLSAVVFEMFTALVNLDAQLDRCIILIVDPQTLGINWYLTGKEGLLSNNGFFVQNNSHPSHQAYLEGWSMKREKWHYILSGEEKKNWDAFGFTQTELAQLPDFIKADMSAVETIYLTISSNDFGSLIASSLSPLSDLHASIVYRFTTVFNQTYTRFLDLQKAEAQAREAQVEASLERIRSKVTAMQESSDLLDIVVTMRSEFVALGHNADYFWYMRYLPEIYEKAMTSGDGTRIGMVMTLPRHIHGDIKMVADWEESVEPTLVFPMDVETAVEYIHKMITLGNFKQVDPNAPTLDDIRHIGGLTFVMARTTHGEIGYSLAGVVTDPPKDDLATLARFAAVFDLAYRRFEDIQSKENQAREAIKQASLDRVRGQIASMRDPEDLQHITPLIWRELKTLEVPFFRCGIFIINEKEENVHVYLATPDGRPLAALHLAFDSSELTRKTFASWKRNEVYQEHWDKQKFIDWMHQMMKLRQVKTEQDYQGAAEPPESLHLHFIPFAQGMLYIGNTDQFEEEKFDLVRSLAEAFSFAYARYEDFVVLEEAKEKVEKALGDLKATQSQLIHAEKMASLGELTAGIAHEIQNPLNFVNNFAEVSTELIDEMKQELAAGSWQQAGEIADDLKQNLEKINYHGKRADGIVKGMLHHSRTSSGQKEPTDINALADEYLRLAYHGLRAKDKSFNATMKTDFDESIGNINIIPQDIGRVLLNLINNAFYAVSNRNLSALSNLTGSDNRPKNNLSGSANLTGSNYQPTVVVSTKNLGNLVEIRVKDNGDGIPDEIKDKIFQPFFTTKPTGQGTGLGLSLSYDIITKGHGGELKVRSEPGEGTEFIINLKSTSL
jgi:signal transduction histidine kinase